MIITDSKKLKDFASDKRIWQGIPGIEITKGGRLFATFYSGNIAEYNDNYSAVVISDDDGKSWSEPIAVAYAGKEYRCFDPTLWLDPLGRLWFCWGQRPEDALWASVCENPDAETLSWSTPRIIGHNVMMNKPIVLSTGEWLFPIAVWRQGLMCFTADTDRRAFAYRTVDQGKTFTCLGGVEMPDRMFDEHMLLEQNDGSVKMFVRTTYGVGESVSYNGGVTWSEGVRSPIEGPNSRFHIRRLPSGNILLVTHINCEGQRKNLMAKLSRDGGKTWEGGFMIDERPDVSYPDSALGADGSIYIAYDHDRGSFLQYQSQAQRCHRAILFAKITEEDILAGKLVNKNSSVRNVITALSDCTYTGPDLHKQFRENKLPKLLRELSLESDGDKIVQRLFNEYNMSCMSMNGETVAQTDALVEKLYLAAANDDFDGKLRILRKLFDLFSENDIEHLDQTKEWTTGLIADIQNNLAENWSLEKMAQSLAVSKYYLCHFFKRETGMTVMQYLLYCRITAAKRLLIATDLSVSEICEQCGFCSLSYFTQTFRADTGITPKQYRIWNTK